MDAKLLELTPKRYLCPICGNWHKWCHSYPLSFHSYINPATFSNKDLYPEDCAVERYSIYVEEGYLHYYTGKMCNRAKLNLDGKIPIDSIKEADGIPIVGFEVDFTSKSELSEDACRSCYFSAKCNLLKQLGDQEDRLHMTIPLEFEFDRDEYFAVQTAHKEKKSRNAVTSQEPPQEKENKEDNTTMANNIFNMNNMEFGPNKDENIASTLMGVAVKNEGSWRIYDKATNAITDVGDMKLGDFPLFIMPETDLEEGDLIKDAGEYYFVTKVATADEPYQMLSARTGELKTVVPVKSILGFSIYSKVVSIIDSTDIGTDFDPKELAFMSAMFGGENGEPGNQMNQMLPLFLAKKKLGGNGNKKKLMFLSSMMGGNAAGSNNWLMGYLMLDAFGEKDGTDPQAGGGAATK